MPVLDSHVNRVNTASSIGAAILIVGFIGLLTSFMTMYKRQTQSVILVSLVFPIIILFVLADWRFAVPWIVSWDAHLQVIDLIKKKAKQIKSGDTIILANLPRYTMWAPVFDGIWDFQSALQIVLNRRDIYGGVLSDRMVVTPSAIEDRFKTYLCARYPFKQIIVLVPNPETWIPINTPQQFMDLSQKYHIPIGREYSDKKF